MINKSKMKVYVFILGLMLAVGQGFAQESSQSSAPESSSSSKMDLWSNYTSEPQTQDIGGLTYYSITSAEELAWFAAKVNTTEKGKPNVSSGINAILLNDIDLSGKMWTPIAVGKGDTKFSGILDGNNHKITGLTIDGLRLAYETENIYCSNLSPSKPYCNGQNIGLIGSLGGTVKNLNLEVADIQASNSEGLSFQTGKPISVGTLVGWMGSGTIDGVYVNGHINTSGNGQGVGGIVGNAQSGTVKNSVCDVTIYASGDDVFVGGILGYTKGAVNVNSCMYVGESIANDGANGSVGGIVGKSTVNSLNATNSYYDTDVVSNGVGTGSVNNNKKPTGVTDLNTEQVACGMNGGTWNANTQVCSNATTNEWEVGISELSQNGSDGYKITFVVNGNGAAFPDGAVATKLVAKNAAITADGISLPTREGYKFAGWAETDDAEDPSANLGLATGRRTIYAVWYGKFPVTFNAGTGSFPNGTPDPLMVAKGDLISLDIDVPVKASIDEDHFYFAGWTTGSEVIFEKEEPRTGLVDFDVFTVSAATDFYPAWTKDVVHTVKFNANGHGQTKLEQVDVSDGSMLNAPDNPSPYTGYKYDAWCLVQDCQNESDFFTFPQTINSSFELFAKWSAVSYTINYNLDGGSVSNPGNPSTYTVEDQFVLKAPSKACYDFIGWYDLNGNHVEGITKGTTEEKTFSARWEQQRKVINYSTGNVIQATAASQDFLCGESVTLSDTINAFSRPGYTQDGWTTTIGGNNVMAPKASYTGTETVTLYAHWSLNNYNIIYNLNDGEFATPAISSYTTEDAVVLAVPTRDGYEFDGWYTNADFNGNKVSSIAAGSIGDTTFFAKWTPVEYTITYENVNGATNDNATTYTIEQTVALNALEKDGFVFAGWYDNAQFEGNAATEISAGASGDTTFYAKWLEIFTITYAAGEGEGITGEVDAGTKIEGENATLSDVGFTREGYTQTGWKTEDGSVTYAMGAIYTTDASVTLYPIWEAEVYHVYYHNIEGATFETENPTTYTVEDVFPIALNSPSKSGFNFLGWSLTENSTKYVDGIAAGSTGEANFYANWELAPSPITVTASSGLFEYDGEIHNATCSYEGVVPVGYSIAMVPSGSVQNVSEGEVTTSCAVTITDNTTSEDATALFSEVLDVVDGLISIKAKEVKNGAVTILADENGTRAEINGEYTGKDEYGLDEEISVNSVVLNRSFVPYVPVTLTLPFDIAVENVENAKFYVFGGISVGENGKKAVEANRVKEGTLAANTPYMVVPTGTSILFNGSVTFRETVDPVTTVGTWQFCGTYSYKTVAAENVNSVYGISGSADGDIPQGSFVKFKAGSWFVPMRAYLLNTEVSNRRLARAYSAASVNNSRFEIIWNEGDEETVDEQTTSVRKPVVSSKIVNMRRVYDLKGRQVNGETKVKGAYYNKKVVK